MQHLGVSTQGYHPYIPYLRDICVALLYHISLETPLELELILLNQFHYNYCYSCCYNYYYEIAMIAAIIIAMIVTMVAAMGLL